MVKRPFDLINIHLIHPDASLSWNRILIFVRYNSPDNRLMCKSSPKMFIIRHKYSSGCEFSLLARPNEFDQVMFLIDQKKQVDEDEEEFRQSEESRRRAGGDRKFAAIAPPPSLMVNIDDEVPDFDEPLPPSKPGRLRQIKHIV